MPKHLLKEEEAREMLSEAAWGRLATLGPQGPYITPMHFVIFENTIYFHSFPRGTKLSYIRLNERVCFEVSELFEIVSALRPCKFNTRYRSVQVFGKAQIIEETEEKIFALNLLGKKYFGVDNFKPISIDEASSVAVIALRIERISGRANLD